METHRVKSPFVRISLVWHGYFFLILKVYEKRCSGPHPSLLWPFQGFCHLSGVRDFATLKRIMNSFSYANNGQMLADVFATIIACFVKKRSAAPRYFHRVDPNINPFILDMYLVLLSVIFFFSADN